MHLYCECLYGQTMAIDTGPEWSDGNCHPNI